MIKQFSSKKLKLVTLLDHNNEDVTFLDIVFNRFRALTKIFTNQGIKFCGEFQELCEKINHCVTSRDYPKVDGEIKFVKA
jgi:hypothetical protein